MTSIEDMKSCIQEWMAQPIDAVDLAITYAECRMELDKQLEFCMMQFTKEDEE